MTARWPRYSACTWLKIAKQIALREWSQPNWLRTVAGRSATRWQGGSHVWTGDLPGSQLASALPDVHRERGPGPRTARVDLVLFSLVRSGELVVQPQVSQVRTAVRYLEDRLPLRQRAGEHLAVLRAGPMRYLRAALFAWRRRDLASGYATATSIECFRYAVRVTATVVRLRDEGRAPTHLHAHFAHDPAPLVALLVRRLTGLPYSFTLMPGISSRSCGPVWRLAPPRRPR